MTNLMDALTPSLNYNGDNIYKEADIRRLATEVVELEDKFEGSAPRSLLALLRSSDYPSHLSFGVFDFAMSEIGGANAEYVRVFSGYGYTDGLRELRHTYWGDPEGGYIFYPRASLIIAAMTALQKWFDCD